MYNLKNIIFFENEFKTDNFQYCLSKEQRFFHLFTKENNKFRFGFLIYADGSLMGAIKIKGEKNMLSLKTENNSIPLRKFGIYMLPLKVINFLLKIDHIENKTWTYVNFKKLYLKDSCIDLENFEKLKNDKEIKVQDYKRVLENTIEKEFTLWEHRKNFDIEFDETFFEEKN
jgi:hypothetical protein